MNRRNILLGAISGAGVLLAARFTLTGESAEEQIASPTNSGTSAVDNTITAELDWRQFAAEGASFPAVSDVIKLSKQEWQERLDPIAFQVLRKEGTERPFTSPFNNEHRQGLYVCSGCELPLFTSAMKYDSGTGWPSFTDRITTHVDTKRDFKLILPRTEYHCKRCGGHQGHLFKDGPEPTGQRWCNNGVALKFIPA